MSGAGWECQSGRLIRPKSVRGARYRQPNGTQRLSVWWTRARLQDQHPGHLASLKTLYLSLGAGLRSPESLDGYLTFTLLRHVYCLSAFSPSLVSRALNLPPRPVYTRG